MRLEWIPFLQTLQVSSSFLNQKPLRRIDVLAGRDGGRAAEHTGPGRGGVAQGLSPFPAAFFGLGAPFPGGSRLWAPRGPCSARGTVLWTVMHGRHLKDIH